ncbi:erythroblast NAD(P)(+)--arginine ADP-ribosyltransferase-like [Toxotes jaculatrix]|uniref:erythroblast NAD(P)(+)--arginine ADP-ribosyltransferase-like n=1 Tax=Toxotes jaculatrix TaxID=941984 RepID=UPI001B3B0609|nr:erythroblast NAD(P)(+)--arginine ADP-ribosyltransferase-like [Toxotes jaculatrix]
MSPEAILRTGRLIKTFDLTHSLGAQHLLILKTGTIFLTAVVKGDMLIFAPLCLLLCWKIPVDSMRIHFDFSLRDANQDIPLSMVEDSVDDMYFGCNEAMMKMVSQKYSGEMYMEPFSRVWREAKVCAEKKQIHKGDEALTTAHLEAICVYTSDQLYKMFNDAVRTNRSVYGSSFEFHSLHFLLTSAIQILNNYYCHTAYRRTSVRFSGQVNQRVRFGSFTSSSYNTDLTDFGSETCFKIKTCTGAFLKDYSTFGDAEAEVLIPPYEVFNITQKIEDQQKIQDLGVKSCKLMYILESTGCVSNLNCKAVRSE